MPDVVLDIQPRATAELELVVGGGSSAVELGIENGHTSSWYEGPYEVTPSRSEQTLATRHRTMHEDVTVHEIPYYETANPYGITYIIGE